MPCCCPAEGLRQISFQLQKLGMKDEPAYDDLRALLEVTPPVLPLRALTFFGGPMQLKGAALVHVP